MTSSGFCSRSDDFVVRSRNSCVEKLLPVELSSESVAFVSRMTTRSMMWVCVGLLAVAAGVVLVRSLPVKSGVEVSFVRYADNGPAVLKVTNRGQSPLLCASQNAWFYSDVPPRAIQWSVVLMPRSDTQLLASPHASQAESVLGATVSLRCVPQASKLRQRVEVLLSKVGISIANTGFVATVQLPAR